jgi:arylsulfatase/arylsulfatase A
VKTKGYCTDVFTNAAVKFLMAEPGKPFFAYVSFNAPHAPYQVPDADAAPYRKVDLSPDAFPKVGQRWATKKMNKEDVANAYGMIANVDANFGRLMAALDEAKLSENTIVIFLTDNGPGGVRFNGGLRDRKGTTYEGGLRVPCYVRWPGKFPAGNVVDVPTAHIDLTPTLVNLCGVERDGKQAAFDGRDLSKVLRGDAVKWQSRTLIFQWHRGDEPEKNRAFAARGPRYKLVQAAGVQPGTKWTPKFELFDIQADPFEQTDLADKLPDEVAGLKREYEAWFADVTKNGFAPPRIVLGSEKENPVRLSRQDWRGEKAGWAADSVGHWEVEFERAGRYELTARSVKEFSWTSWIVKYDGRPAGEGVRESKDTTRASGPTKKESNLTGNLVKGPARLYATVGLGSLQHGSEGPGWGVQYLEVKYLGPAK